MRRGVFPSSLLAFALLMLPVGALAQSLSQIAASARTELSAGQSPRSGTGEAERALIAELKLGLGVRRESERHETTLRYSPRLWYRPETVIPERPLVYHQLLATHERELDPRSRLNLSLGSTLGELAYSTLIDDAVGTTHGTLETQTFSLFTVSSSAGWEHAASRVTQLALEASGGYRTPTTLSAAPGVEVSRSESTIPKSAEASLALLAKRRFSRRLELSFPLSAGYFWSEVADSLGVLSAEAAASYALTELTDLEVAAGATYLVSPGSAVNRTVPVFPLARVGLRTILRRSEALEWNASASVTHAGYFDALQGDYRPAAGLALLTQYRYYDWSISASALVSTLTAEQLYPNEARSDFRLMVPVTVRFNRHLDLSFGAQASARSREFPPGRLELEQIEILGFIAFSAVTGTGTDSRWVL